MSLVSLLGFRNVEYRLATKMQWIVGCANPLARFGKIAAQSGIGPFANNVRREGSSRICGGMGIF